MAKYEYHVESLGGGITGTREEIQKWIEDWCEEYGDDYTIHVHRREIGDWHRVDAETLTCKDPQLCEADHGPDSHEECWTIENPNWPSGDGPFMRFL